MASAGQRNSMPEYEAGTKEALASGGDGDPSDEEDASPCLPATGSRDHPLPDTGDVLIKWESVLKTSFFQLLRHLVALYLVAAVLTTIILNLRFITETFWVKGHKWSVYYLKYMAKFVVIGATTLLESGYIGLFILPVFVFFTLRLNMSKMKRDNNGIMKHSEACASIGCTTSLCLEKDVLCSGRRVVSIWTCRTLINNASDFERFPHPVISLVTESMVTISSSLSANTLASAINEFLLELSQDVSKPEMRPVVENIAFSPKLMCSVVKLGDDDGYRVFIGGEPTVVLQKCSLLLTENSSVESMESREEMLIKEVIESMSVKGLHKFCFAFKDLVQRKPNQPYETRLEGELDLEDEFTLSSRLTLLCLMGTEDTLQPNVSQTMRRLRAGGLVVCMVTEDNVSSDFVKKCGSNDDLRLNGRQFNAAIRDAEGIFQTERFDEVWPRLNVLSCCSSIDKYILIKNIMRSSVHGEREIVAYFGKDVNCLSRADVGITGSTSSQPAETFASIILPKHCLNDALEALMLGRNAMESIRKLLQYLLTVNLVELVLIFFGACLVEQSFFSSIQTFCANLMVVILSFGILVREDPAPNLLEEPRERNTYLVSRTMFVKIIGQAAFQLAVIFTLSLKGRHLFDVEDELFGVSPPDAPPSLFSTFIYNVFLAMNIFNVVNCRRLRGERNVFIGLFSLSNCAVFLFVALLQVLIVSYGGRVFSTATLSFDFWMWSLFFGLSGICWGQFLLLFADLPQTMANNRPTTLGSVQSIETSL